MSIRRHLDGVPLGQIIEGKCIKENKFFLGIISKFAFWVVI